MVKNEKSLGAVFGVDSVQVGLNDALSKTVNETEQKERCRDASESDS